MIRPSDGEFSARDLVLAGILTAILPTGLAATGYWLAPWGCDASAWLCLLPLSLLNVAPFAAVILPLAVFFNRRRRHRLPDGWVSIVVATAIVAQASLSGASLWMSEPHMRRLFFFDLLIVPQGLVAGAIVGAVFRGALTAFARGRRGC